MRFNVVSTLAVGVMVVVSCSTQAADEKKEATHEYVGVKKCKICHMKDGIHPSWETSAHAVAWDNLPEAEKKKEDLKKYYTTGMTADGELLTGVQCEACHGPGADYKKKSVMEDREQALAAGLLIPDETTCKGCHNAEAPPALAKIAKDFDFKKMVAKGVHVMSADSAAAPK